MTCNVIRTHICLECLVYRQSYMPQYMKTGDVRETTRILLNLLTITVALGIG